jgi:hypothetical protein
MVTTSAAWCKRKKGVPLVAAKVCSYNYAGKYKNIDLPPENCTSCSESIR